jgi:hypothetical protein
MEEKDRSEQADGEVVERDVAAKRREFLKKCGRFAVYAAPAMVMILTYDANRTAAGS